VCICVCVCVWVWNYEFEYEYIGLFAYQCVWVCVCVCVLMYKTLQKRLHVNVGLSGPTKAASWGSLFMAKMGVINQSLANWLWIESMPSKRLTKESIGRSVQIPSKFLSAIIINSHIKFKVELHSVIFGIYCLFQGHLKFVVMKH